MSEEKRLAERITKDEIELDNSNGIFPKDKTTAICFVNSGLPEAQPNKELIAEAFNITNQTGLSPKELNDELAAKSAELLSLKMSITEELHDFLPKREMSFHDKTVFAIAELKEQRGKMGVLLERSLQEMEYLLRDLKEVKRGSYRAETTIRDIKEFLEQNKP